MLEQNKEGTCIAGALSQLNTEINTEEIVQKNTYDFSVELRQYGFRIYIRNC